MSDPRQRMAEQLSAFAGEPYHQHGQDMEHSGQPLPGDLMGVQDMKGANTSSTIMSRHLPMPFPARGVMAYAGAIPRRSALYNRATSGEHVFQHDMDEMLRLFNRNPNHGTY